MIERHPSHDTAPPCPRAASLPAGGFCARSLPPTPLVPVQLCEDSPTIYCTLECFNPSGSTKDRIASHILAKAWRRGDIGPGSRVVEASSGSTSIAMAMVCAQLGLRFTAVMPEGVSRERTVMIRSFGGEVHFCDPNTGIVGAIAEAGRLAEETGAFFPRQFENPDNAEAHRVATAREIVQQLPGCTVDAFATGVGTGGTLVGLYHGFRDVGINATPVAARPVDKDGSVTKATGCFGGTETCSFSTKIPGVVDNMSKLYKPEELDNLVQMEVWDEEAIETARKLITLGFPVGPSSGLNFVAAQTMAARLGPDATGVTGCCDRMERYFSTEMFTRAAAPASAPTSTPAKA